jgi:hypothetical protein
MAYALEGRVISYWIPEAIKGTSWDAMPVYHPDSHDAPPDSWDVLVIPVPRGRMEEVKRRVLEVLSDVPPHLPSDSEG